MAFRCPCGERLAVETRYAGTVVMCPTCRAHVQAPQSGARGSLGGGRAAYRQRLAQQARANFARRTRLAGIILGALMLATMVIPAPEGSRTRMVCQWRSVATTGGVLVLVLGTWVAGAGAIVAALLPAGLKRSTVFLCVAAVAMVMPLAALLVASGGAGSGKDLAGMFRPMKSLRVLAVIGATVSIFGLLAVGHARLQIGGGVRLRACQGAMAVILLSVFGPLTVQVIAQAAKLARASGEMMAVFGFETRLWVWTVTIFLTCVSLLAAGLAAGANACRRRMSRGLSTTSLLLIYIPLGMAAALAMGIPLRAAGVEGLAIGALACFLILPRLALASLAAATLIVACVRAGRTTGRDQGLEVLN